MASRNPTEVKGEDRDPRYPPDHGRGRNPKSRKLRRERHEKFFQQEGRCWWCRKMMSMASLRINEYGNWKQNQQFASFEHLIPRSHGGLDISMNRVLAHAACNNRRHRTKWPHDPVYGDAANPIYAGRSNDHHQASEGELPKVRPWFHCEAADRGADEPRCVAGEREQDHGGV